LQPKHVVRGRSDRSSSILDRIILCHLTPEDGHLWPKPVVRGRSDRSSYVLDGIISCIMTESTLTQMQNLLRMRNISFIMTNRKEDCKLYTVSPQFTRVCVIQICRYNATQVLF
jgi:hypothetical protein